jgi:hypothetical protein
MTETMVFVDAEGMTKDAKVTYTVASLSGQDASFGSAKDAAKAFNGLDSSDSPVVIRSVVRADGVVRDSVVAGFDVRKVKGAAGRTLERLEDRIFNEAMGEVVDEVKAEQSLEKGRHVASEGLHVGPIVGYEGHLIGMKSGRGPGDLVWHDISKLRGDLPKIGSVAEIGYSKGVGMVKPKEMSRDVDDVGGGRDFER